MSTMTRSSIFLNSAPRSDITEASPPLQALRWKMAVFGRSGGGFSIRKQAFPVNCEAEVSQRLLEASYSGNLKSALECISNPFMDVNFVGAVCCRCCVLEVKRIEVLLHDELASEAEVEYEEFRTDVTALFLAVHAENVAHVRKLLSIRDDVNQKLFRSFTTTAVMRELNMDLFRKCMKPVEKCLRDAKMDKCGVYDVVPFGGMWFCLVGLQGFPKSSNCCKISSMEKSCARASTLTKQPVTLPNAQLCVAI